MDNIYVVSGKCTDVDFVKSQLTDKSGKKRDDLFVIGVDSGLDALCKLKIVPDFVVGDFDSLSRQTKVALGLVKHRSGDEAPFTFDLYDYQILKLNPEKNDTDTEAAVKYALRYKDGPITILGATSGNRIDHLLGNIIVLALAREYGRDAVLLDENNRIRLCYGAVDVNRDEAYGKYISVIPFYSEITDVTLSGFKYNLTNGTLKKTNTLGLSNEIVDEVAHIECNGTYVLIESKD